MSDSEEIKQYYDRLKKYGPYSTLAQYNKGGPKSRYIAAVFDLAMLPYFKDTKELKVLDFGCAAGILTNQLTDRVKLAVGADISPGMLELARERAFEKASIPSYVRIDGSNLPFKNSQLDAIISRESLLHVPDNKLPDLLAEFSRILRPGGRYYCLEQASESAYWRDQAGFTLKRSIDEYLKETGTCGFVCENAYVVRQPRFFWIYLFWFRLLPARWISFFAGLEVRFNGRFIKLKTKRWHNVLFVFKKISNS